MLKPFVLTVILQRIKSLDTKGAYGRPNTLSTEYILDRIVYVMKTGCQWSALPVTGGCWKTIYHYFAKWSKARIFEGAHQDLVKFYTRRGLSDALVVDTSFVKNVWGRDCLGRSPVDRG